MFDKRKNFGRMVSGDGTTRAVYYQDGKHYDANYNLVTEDGKLLKTLKQMQTEEGIADPPKQAAPEAEPTPAAPAAPGAVETANLPNSDDEPDYESMSWQSVKTLVEQAGGKWTNKIQGIAYLRSI